MMYFPLIFTETLIRNPLKAFKERKVFIFLQDVFENKIFLKSS